MVFRHQYNEPIRHLAQTQIMNATSDLINDAIDKQIEDGKIQYDRIVYFEKDLNGRITALKTNMSEINRLKTDTLNLINDEILALDSSDLAVPLGSLFLPEFLSGKGPTIPVQIISIRNSDANFNSHFTQAGINQTRHQLTMSVGVDVAVLVLGESASFTVTSEVVVAETIIVGDVPDTFFQTGGTYGSTAKN
jgi:sporulation protein YunB